ALGFGWAEAAAARGPASQVWGSYSFYAFYNTSPYLLRWVSRVLRPGSTATEYARYVETARHLGGFAENGGSIARALVRPPGYAALWLAAKPFDLLTTIGLPDAFPPAIAVAAVLAARRARAAGARAAAARWTPTLAAFAAPLAFALIWSQGGH